MQKDDLWRLILAKNPGWAEDGANLTASGLRKLFDVAFDQGQMFGMANRKAMAGYSEVIDRLGEFLKTKDR